MTYRNQAEVPMYYEERTVEKTPSLWPYRLEWIGRVAIVLQGPILAGYLHDICTKQHEGLCTAIGFVAMAATVGGFVTLLHTPPEKPGTSGGSRGR